MADKACSCPGSVYGGFKQGVGFFLAGALVTGVPIFLLAVFALPAYLGSLSRAAASGSTNVQPTIRGAGLAGGFGVPMFTEVRR